MRDLGLRRTFRLLVVALCGLGVFAAEEQFVPLDHVQGTRVMCGASGRDGVLFLMSHFQRGSMPRVFTYLYDMQKQAVREIDDPRVKSTFAAQVAPRRDGFAYAAPFLKCVYFLDARGDLQDIVHLDAFDGMEDGFQLNYVYPLGEDLWMGTYRKRGDTAYALVILDLQAEALTIQHRVESPDPVFWVPVTGGYYEVRPMEGKLQRLDGQTFAVKNTVVDLKAKETYRGRDAFAFGTVLVSGDIVSVFRNVYRDMDGKELDPLGHQGWLFHGRDDRRQTAPFVVVGRIDARTVLGFHLADQEMRVVPTPWPEVP